MQQSVCRRSNRWLLRTDVFHQCSEQVPEVHVPQDRQKPGPGPRHVFADVAARSNKVRE